MTHDQLVRCVQRYAASVQAHTRAIEAMDEAGANRHALFICRLQESIIWDPAGAEALMTLLDHESADVRGMAALHLLPLHPEPALEVLRQLALMPGLMGFRASVALERWAKGELGGNASHGA